MSAEVDITPFSEYKFLNNFNAFELIKFPLQTQAAVDNNINYL